jgi:hypothetical protein
MCSSHAIGLPRGSNHSRTQISERSSSRLSLCQVLPQESTFSAMKILQGQQETTLEPEVSRYQNLCACSPAPTVRSGRSRAHSRRHERYHERHQRVGRHVGELRQDIPNSAEIPRRARLLIALTRQVGQSQERRQARSIPPRRGMPGCPDPEPGSCKPCPGAGR